jgi:hypothetical protein
MFYQGTKNLDLKSNYGKLVFGRVKNSLLKLMGKKFTQLFWDGMIQDRSIFAVKLMINGKIELLMLIRYSHIML